jgi:hypothetical protein
LWRILNPAWSSGHGPSPRAVNQELAYPRQIRPQRLAPEHLHQALLEIYLVGVGVILSPTVRSEWNSAPASVLAENIARELPDALAWPVRAARGVTGALPSTASRLSAN